MKSGTASPAIRRCVAHVGSRFAVLTGLVALLGGCSMVGDFDRPRPSVFNLDATAWIGPAAVRARNDTPSIFALTEDEKLLRDLAYPLIVPPYDRNRWDRVLIELQQAAGIPTYSAPFDRTVYGNKLLETPYRSATARYGRLVDDIRDDMSRIEPFVTVARRVVDMDRKREKSLAYVSAPNADERVNAMRRINENITIIGWVKRSLGERSTAYRHALERLVVATPSPMAVEAERTLAEFNGHISAATTPPPVADATPARRPPAIN